MVIGDNTMTNIEHFSSTGELCAVEGNGHVPEKVQSSVSSESAFGNGEAKAGIIQASPEHSTFGVISNNSSSYVHDAIVSASSRRPERVKIIVKRKVVAEEVSKEVQAISPSKKQKLNTFEVVAGEDGLVELKTTTLTGSLEQEATEFESEIHSEAEQASEVGDDKDGTGTVNNRTVDISPEDDQGRHRNDPGLMNGGGEYMTSKSYDNTMLCLTSSKLLSSSPSSFQSCFHTQFEPVGETKASVDGLSRVLLGDIGSVQSVPSALGIDSGAFKEEPSVFEDGKMFAQSSPDAAQPSSPTPRSAADGLFELGHTPKAKRTPLFFLQLEKAVEDILPQSPSQLTNPLTTSTPAPPAKRSPLPLPSVKSASPRPAHFEQGEQEDVNTTNEEHPPSEEGTDLCLLESQSREEMEGEEKYGEEESPNDGVEAEEEFRLDVGEEAEVEDEEKQELEFVFQAELRPLAEEEDQDALDEEDLADDFVAALKFDMTELDRDPQVHATSNQHGVNKYMTRGTSTPSVKSENAPQYDMSASMGASTILSHSGFLFQSLVNGGGKDENDLESASQERDLDSDQLDATCHDTGGTSNSQLSEDRQDEEGISSGHLSKPRRVHQGLIQPWAGQEGSPENGSFSPEDTYPSSEVLQKSERPVKVEDLDSLHKGYTKRIEAQERRALPTKLPMSTQSTIYPVQPSSAVKRLKVKMSSEVSAKQGSPVSSRTLSIKEAPTTAKALLATGLLEGYRVRYLDRAGGVMLTGKINNSGILCDCTKCKGQQTVNVSAFEKHAGSSARHPSDFIFLDNGKNLHDVMEAGWKAGETGRKVVEALKLAMGLSVGKRDPDSCIECGTGGTVITCSGARCSGAYHLGCAGLSQPPEGEWLCSQCSSAESRRRLLKANSSLSRESSTVKDSSANMHKALFLPGALEDDIEVGYYVKGQRFLTGVKKGNGICCGCCGQVVSCSQFEQHAGWGSRRNPYSSIYLADGQSLHCAALALNKKGNETPVENVDYCTECGDGGDLVLCDGCPGAYHPECAGLVSVPDGNFFCPRCKKQRGTSVGSARKVTTKIRVKSSSKTAGALIPGKESTDDRCTRLLKATDTVSSGCVFCRSGEFAKSGFGPRTILLCDQCEREFHVGCLNEHGLANLTELPEGEWFCGKDCEHIHSILHLLVANGMEPLADSIISKVIESKQPQESGEDVPEPNTPSFSWQLLHGRRGDPMNGRTLTEAAAIFSESFDPIVDESSGRDLIPLMVHSRSIRDQDFGGMHCVVLKRNDLVVTAALVRIFGRQFAELPLVATRNASQGQGFCKALILSIERLLGVLNVERLVLPAAEGAEGIWVKNFGFSQLSEEESRKFRSEVQMMIFKGSSLLKKAITPLAIK